MKIRRSWWIKADNTINLSVAPKLMSNWESVKKYYQLTFVSVGLFRQKAWCVCERERERESRKVSKKKVEWLMQEERERILGRCWGLSTNGDLLIEPGSENGQQHFSFSPFHHCSLSLGPSGVKDTNVTANYPVWNPTELIKMQHHTSLWSTSLCFLTWASL